MDHDIADRPTHHRRRGPAGALLLGWAALAALTGCSAATGTALADVERTGVSVTDAPGTGSTAAGTPTTAPDLDHDHDEADADRVTLVQDLGVLPGITTREAGCFLRELDAAIGADATDELLAAYDDEDASVDDGDAAEAGATAARCVELDRVTRTMLQREWDASPSEARCVTMHLGARELETLATMRFLPFDQFDADHDDLLDTFLTETGSCSAEVKVHAHLAASMLEGGADDGGAECYADTRLDTLAPGEALRIEYGSRTLDEGRGVLAAMRSCIDLRAMFADALTSDETSAEEARCVVGLLDDADLETIVLGLITREGLGRAGADAQAHFQAAGDRCVAGPGA